MNRRDYDPAAERRALDEGDADVAEWRLLLGRLLVIEEFFMAASAATPVELHGALRALIAAEVTNPESAYNRGRAECFFGLLRTRGLVHAVMDTFDRPNPAVWPRSADYSLVRPVFHYILTNPDGAGDSPVAPRTRVWWLDVALSSVACHTDPAEAAGLLAEYLRADSPPSLRLGELCPAAATVAETAAEDNDRRELAQSVRAVPAKAAINLSGFAPVTPGLRAVLLAALGRDGYGWDQPSESSYRVRDAAATALAALGPRGRPAVPQLRAEVLDPDNDDRRAAFDAFTELCADAAEVAALMDEVAATGRPTNDLLRSAKELAGSNPALVPGLVRLVEGCSWDREADTYWSDALSAVRSLSEAGRTADTVLPILAAALNTTSYDQTPMKAFHKEVAAVASDFFDRLRTGARTDEESFLIALCGLPPAKFPWLIYADWLDERDDPRGELVRLRNAGAAALLTGDSDRWCEADGRVDEWTNAHGRGWNELYGIVARS